jgi:hypothetical protein
MRMVNVSESLVLFGRLAASEVLPIHCYPMVSQ